MSFDVNDKIICKVVNIIVSHYEILALKIPTR